MQRSLSNGGPFPILSCFLILGRCPILAVVRFWILSDCVKINWSVDSLILFRFARSPISTNALTARETRTAPTVVTFLSGAQGRGFHVTRSVKIWALFTLSIPFRVSSSFVQHVHKVIVSSSFVQHVHKVILWNKQPPTRSHSNKAQQEKHSALHNDSIDLNEVVVVVVVVVFI